MRHRADNNQGEIVAALRDAHCAVHIIQRPLDLLVWSPYKREYFLGDCKSKTGKLTKAQKDFVKTWPGPWYIWRSVDDALKTVGARLCYDESGIPWGSA